MPKKLEDPYDFMVCVKPTEPWFKVTCKEYSERMRSACEEVKQQVRRHIDGIGQVYIECSQDYVCEFCGYRWGYPDSDYNGGCCDEDEKNNPEYKQGPTEAEPIACIFVFGSNLAGRHGKGAALNAHKNYGAIHGIGEGRQGQRYAIPTKDDTIQTLPLPDIQFYIHKFLSYATDHPELQFFVTNIGCGLAEYTPEQIAPMFKGAPGNCFFSKEFQRILNEDQT